jgi:hypothetical protein
MFRAHNGHQVWIIDKFVRLNAGVLLCAETAAPVGMRFFVALSEM